MSSLRIWHAGGKLIGVRNTAKDARTLLKNAANPPTVHLYPRADGPGSSQDLPQFAAMAGRVALTPIDFQDPQWNWSTGCLRTPGACIDSDPIEYRVVPADDPQAYEYYAPDFHTRPLAIRDPVPGRPEFFVHNVLRQFGLVGIRIEAAPMPAVVRGTGLGGSNLAHAAAMILGSAVAGVPLNLAQIYVAATQLENNFGVEEKNGELSVGVSITGGQETLTAFQGGVWDNVHLPIEFGPHGVVSRELVSPVDYGLLARHLLLVNLGRRRAPGVTSSGVNRDWIRAWRSQEGARLHTAKLLVAWEAAEAMRTLDWTKLSGAISRYRELRVKLSARYVEGQEELADLCRKVDASWFPVGAGSGTCLVAASDSASIEEIQDRVNATRELETGRTIIPFLVRSKGVEFLNFTENGLRIPQRPRSRSAPNRRMAAVAA